MFIAVLTALGLAAAAPGTQSQGHSNRGANSVAAVCGDVAPDVFDKLPAAKRRSLLSCWLRESSKKINGTLPKQIDGSTILESTSASGVTLTYHNKVDVLRSDIPADRLPQFKQTVRDKVCSSEDMVTMLKHGAAYRYEWIDRNRQLITTLLVDGC